MNTGLANYLAQKKAKYGIKPSPISNAPMVAGQSSSVPMAPMGPQMVSAIKQSPKGVIPAGLAKYLANKKAGKAKKKGGK